MNLNVWIPVIITVVVVLAFAISLFIRNMKANYDERQHMARNTAYKFSFFFLMVYCFICGILHIIGIKWADTAVQLFLGIILSFVLFLAISILKDAFFTSSRKRNTQAVISFFSYGIVSVLFFLTGLGRGEVLLNNGELSFLVLYLVASACSFVLGLLSVIKMNLEKREAEK